MFRFIDSRINKSGWVIKLLEDEQFDRYIRGFILDFRIIVQKNNNKLSWFSDQSCVQWFSFWKIHCIDCCLLGGTSGVSVAITSEDPFVDIFTFTLTFYGSAALKAAYRLHSVDTHTSADDQIWSNREVTHNRTRFNHQMFRCLHRGCFWGPSVIL